MTTQWNPPETAPLDGTPILADLGWPWLCYATYNTLDDKWCFANLQAIQVGDSLVDTYFENEYEERSALIKWRTISSLL